MIGLSGCGGIFTDSVLTALNDGCQVSFVDNFMDNFGDNFGDNFMDNFVKNFGTISGQFFETIFVNCAIYLQGAIVISGKRFKAIF